MELFILLISVFYLFIYLFYSFLYFFRYFFLSLFIYLLFTIPSCFSYLLRIDTSDKEKLKGYKQARWRLLHLIIVNSNFCLKRYYTFFS